MNYSPLKFRSMPSLLIFLFCNGLECRFFQKDPASALMNLFKCLEENVFNGTDNTCNENIAYGVNIAKGQLGSILKHLSPDGISFEKVHEVEKVAKKVLKELKMKCESSQFYTLIESEIWQNDWSIRKLFMTSEEFEMLYLEEFSEIYSLDKESLLKSGYPNATQSNRCLIMLNKICEIDEECLKEETAYHSIGYSLTHQILLWQNFRQLQCSEKNADLIDKLIEEKCRRVYAQQMYLRKRYRLDEPYILDLLIEQVAICGLEGFQEFLEGKVMEKILGNQMTCGCIKFLDNDRTLGESQTTCPFDAHLNAVAVLALTLHLKYKVLFSSK